MMNDSDLEMVVTIQRSRGLTVSGINRGLFIEKYFIITLNSWCWQQIKVVILPLQPSNVTCLATSNEVMMRGASLRIFMSEKIDCEIILWTLS